jgi:enoyl-CoA hydratase/carnithine racemase
MEGSLETGLELEMLSMTAHGTTEDFAEGIKSFLEGRQPQFPGR